MAFIQMCVSHSSTEAAGHHMTFGAFFKRGMPVVIVSLFVANVYILIFHVAIPWY